MVVLELFEDMVIAEKVGATVSFVTVVVAALLVASAPVFAITETETDPSTSELSFKLKE